MKPAYYISKQFAYYSICTLCGIALLFICSFTHVINAQSTFEANQLIVQLMDGETVEAFVETYNDSKDNLVKLNFLKTLSEPLNIYLLEHDDAYDNGEVVNADEFLKDIKTNHWILAAQRNKIVELRTEPDDALYDSQWQYNNTGENFGRLDADIDAPEAWDLTTGGTTALGDDIVVAVLDGGVNLYHPDLVNNIWTNAGEIPDNGIDDDQNGYIDDFYGWNFNTDSHNVGNDSLGHGHGTPVAGIIGAEGGNGIGVCGINWNVKVMNLAANSTEAAIIEAYSYVLEMRKQYNETGGEKGAFVVATNASLGINNADAADSPMWCSMYDSLGRQGVLSVAATANANTDVDVEGDMPTTCSSDYLITVTNITKQDIKSRSAGFGKTHIDLGAPGNGAFTIRNDGGYGSFGGTSAASPHVAGAIGLMYSLDIPELAEQAITHHNVIAGVIKHVLLKNTDELLSLKDQTVSGGRLNLYKSLDGLYKYYTPDEPIALDEFTVDAYPNPTKDEFHVRFNQLLKEPTVVQILQSNGQIMSSKQYDLDPGMHSAYFNLEDAHPGIYWVRVCNSQSKTIKVFVH